MNFSIEDFFILCTVYFLDNLQNDAYDSAFLQLIGKLLNKSETKFQMFQYFLIIVNTFFYIIVWFFGPFHI